MPDFHRFLEKKKIFVVYKNIWYSIIEEEKNKEPFQSINRTNFNILHAIYETGEAISNNVVTSSIYRKFTPTTPRVFDAIAAHDLTWDPPST